MIQLSISTQSSYLVLCPWCGDCWARLVGSDTSMWFHRHVPCERDSAAAFAYGCLVGGSLLEVGDPELLDQLPKPLLLREFQLTMNSLKEFA